ncbi:hypothetical protein SNE40_017544 [Patella caerulea]|uniref:Uncharacterized protein n=1 Tax=Patella caerulea TaxID=87958 RepID=A0AAN8PQ47_PATCE
MEDLDQRINCSICLSNFRKPKIIDCHHTYCETCLDDYIDKFAVDDKFDCALCRRTITVPPNGAKDFPVNFYVEDQETANNKEEFCVHHGNEILNGYCSDCQLVVCRQCKQTEHQTHEFQSLQDIRQPFVLELQTLKQELADNISQCKSHYDAFNAKIYQKKISTEQLCAEVDLQVDKICKTTHTQGEEIKYILKKTLAEELMNLDATLVKAKRNLFSIKSLYTMSSQMLREASAVEIINSIDLIRQEKEEVCPRYVKAPEVPNIPVPEFHPGDISTEHISRLIGVLKSTCKDNDECSSGSEAPTRCSPPQGAQSGQGPKSSKTINQWSSKYGQSSKRYSRSNYTIHPRRDPTLIWPDDVYSVPLPAQKIRHVVHTYPKYPFQ